MTSSNDSTLFNLPIRSLSTVITDLATLHFRYRRGEEVMIPMVEILLQSGQRINGWILNHGTDKSESIVLVHLAEGKTNDPSEDVCYLTIPSIVGITLFDAHLYAEAQEDGINVPATVTKLEVRRRLQQLNAQLLKGTLQIACSINWENAEDAQPIQLYHLLNNLYAAILDIISDEVGMKALSEKVRHIFITAGNENKITCSNFNLSIQLGLKEPFNGKWDTAGIGKELAELL
jgi:hypothetical protein